MHRDYVSIVVPYNISLLFFFLFQSMSRTAIPKTLVINSLEDFNTLVLPMGLQSNKISVTEVNRSMKFPI